MEAEEGDQGLRAAGGVCAGGGETLKEGWAAREGSPWTAGLGPVEGGDRRAHA